MKFLCGHSRASLAAIAESGLAVMGDQVRNEHDALRFGTRIGSLTIHSIAHLHLIVSIGCALPPA